MIFALYFASGFIAMGCIWLMVETQRLRRKIKAQLASPTPHRRKNRNRPIPERNLFEELKGGMTELERMREEGVRYEFLGMTGSEQE